MARPWSQRFCQRYRMLEICEMSDNVSTLRACRCHNEKFPHREKNARVNNRFRNFRQKNLNCVTAGVDDIFFLRVNKGDICCKAGCGTRNLSYVDSYEDDYALDYDRFYLGSRLNGIQRMNVTEMITGESKTEPKVARGICLRVSYRDSRLAFAAIVASLFT